MLATVTVQQLMFSTDLTAQSIASIGESTVTYTIKQNDKLDAEIKATPAFVAVVVIWAIVTNMLKTNGPKGAAMLEVPSDADIKEYTEYKYSQLN